MNVMKRQKVERIEEGGKLVHTPLVSQTELDRATISELCAEKNDTTAEADADSLECRRKTMENVAKAGIELEQFIRLTALLKEKQNMGMQTCTRPSITPRGVFLPLSQLISLKQTDISKAKSILSKGFEDSERVVRQRRQFVRDMMKLRKNWRISLYSDAVGEANAQSMNLKNILAIDCSYISCGDDNKLFPYRSYLPVWMGQGAGEASVGAPEALPMDFHRDDAMHTLRLIVEHTPAAEGLGAEMFPEVLCAVSFWESLCPTPADTDGGVNNHMDVDSGYAMDVSSSSHNGHISTESLKALGNQCEKRQHDNLSRRLLAYWTQELSNKQGQGEAGGTRQVYHAVAPRRCTKMPTYGSGEGGHKSTNTTVSMEELCVQLQQELRTDALSSKFNIVVTELSKSMITVQFTHSFALTIQLCPMDICRTSTGAAYPQQVVSALTSSLLDSSVAFVKHTLPSMRRAKRGLPSVASTVGSCVSRSNLHLPTTHGTDHKHTSHVSARVGSNNSIKRQFRSPLGRHREPEDEGTAPLFHTLLGAVKAAIIDSGDKK